jgi:hypothetical protein
MQTRSQTINKKEALQRGSRISKREKCGRSVKKENYAQKCKFWPNFDYQSSKGSRKTKDEDNGYLRSNQSEKRNSKRSSSQNNLFENGMVVSIQEAPIYRDFSPVENANETQNTSKPQSSQQGRKRRKTQENYYETCISNLQASFSLHDDSETSSFRNIIKDVPRGREWEAFIDIIKSFWEDPKFTCKKRLDKEMVKAMGETFEKVSQESKQDPAYDESGMK